jgi:NAD(P)-dependent dehydrogenase (short-subunit alcohol dehydrogenase family)
VQTDVSKSDQVVRLVRETLARYGQVDVLINNAAILGPMAKTADIEEEAWRQTLDIDLTGAWLCLKHVLPPMLERGKGAVVQISSIAGLVAFENICAYSVAKAGMMAMTRVAAIEYATQGIRVNAIAAGAIRTPMILNYTGGDPQIEAGLAAMCPMNRISEPEEIAESAMWLASDESSFTTGHTLIASGGSAV